MTQPSGVLTGMFRDEPYLRQAKEEAAYCEQARQVSKAGTLMPRSGFAVYRKRAQR